MVGFHSEKTLTFEGGQFLRHRVVLSTLSSRPILIKRIREDDAEAPGLSPSEISFIRLLDKITKGTVIQINETGTSLFYNPGRLLGGNRISHDCHVSRSISYYLEPLLMLAPFFKQALNIALRGATHSPTDVCVDTIASVSVPLLRRLSLKTPLSPQVEVKRRSIACNGMNGNGRGGLVNFRCDVLNTKLKPIELIEPGFVKRIRGVVFTNRVSAGYVPRVVKAVRMVFNRFTPDVYVHTDHNNHEGCGVGYGLHLVAETTAGCLIGADWSSSNTETTPEQVAESACRMLLEEIHNGGCVDSSHGPLALLYCAVADSDVSRVRVGRLSDCAVQFLRDLDLFFGVRFKIRVCEELENDSSDDEEPSRNDTSSGYGVILSCVGVGLSNAARQRR